uniref:Coenzyme A biosynthesis bifunctional protein CoaBC n=1 Tax=candidate division WOR-3 bacterium TaxID=2052148 RepID=A0A7C4YF68_UNCW3
MKRVLRNKKILIGVSGGIAAYKIPEIVRTLQKNGAECSVILTENGARFVSKYTLDILTEGKVYIDMFSGGLPHIKLAEENDLLAIIPATYNVIGKIASGIADDLLTTIAAAFKKGKILFPSMNTSMLENPVFEKNVQYLKSIGYEIVEPDEGELACGKSGKGRLPDIEKIIFHITRCLSDNIFKNKKVLITAGATQENIDPVRVITNNSSGKMGIEIANAFALLGADVLLLMGSHSVYIPGYLNVKEFKNSEELYSILMENVNDFDILVMAAAVSDFKPEYSSKKIKREKMLNLKLSPTIDILKEISKLSKKPFIVGFCVEDEENIVEEGVRKMKEKGCNIMVANTIETIGSEKTKGYILLDKNENYFEMTKEELAWHLTSLIWQLLH